MDPLEIEFLAENEPIEIVPNFTHSKFCLIRGDVGPFRPGVPVVVPLWLAISFDQKHKCRILAPEWLSVEKLEEIKKQEEESKVFTVMPNEHYMEVAQMVLETVEDLPHADSVRTLVKDIWDLRVAKLRSSIDAFLKSGEQHAALNKLTRMEINTVREFLTKSLDQIQKLTEISQQ